ncbi:MAG: hypothetical protein EXS32_13365 [Opitutus sp.]|nr:hypothetical protein [Opitutus sp.]
MMNHENKRPVVLEDLLRLKRAERPSPEFWDEFERQLRAKQLAALVERRPWWSAIPHALAGLTRYHLPLGATAILAVSFLSVRHYQTAVPGRTAEVRAGESAELQAASTSVVASHGSVTSSLAETAASAPASERVAAGSAAGFAAGSDSSAPAQLAPTNVFSDDASIGQVAQPDLAPAARFVATTLVAASTGEPTPTRNMFGSARGFETRAMPARPPMVEPLSQMATPSDVRRSRLLNAAIASVSLNLPARNTERSVARHLSDDRLYDSISRFDARGNSVAVKF